MIIGYIEKGSNKIMNDNKENLQNNSSKELIDDELKNVNGRSNLSLHFFDTAEQVRFIFFVGDIVYVKETIFSRTVRCEVVGREVFTILSFIVMKMHTL